MVTDMKIMIYFIRAFLLVLHAELESASLSALDFESNVFTIFTSGAYKILASFNILRGIDIISPSRQKGELANARLLADYIFIM